MSTDPIARRSPGILRHWLRFSLGSVFLLITLICLVLGIWIVPAQRLDRAVAEFRKSEANVLYAEQPGGTLPDEPRGPAWLRSLIADHLFESPAEVFFQKDRSNKQIIGDDDLRPLEVLSNLRWFEIEQNSKVTDAGLRHLAKAANLRLLRLRTKPLTNAALAELGSLSRLEHLELYSVAMSGEGFAPLERLANLEAISMLD